MEELNVIYLFICMYRDPEPDPPQQATVAEKGGINCDVYLEP